MKQQISSDYSQQQKFGTNMFSKSGQKTTFRYIAFHQEDPVEVEKRISKRIAKTRTDFTAGIIAGMPATKEQLEKLAVITQEMEKEAEAFRRKILKSSKPDDEMKSIEKFKSSLQLFKPAVVVNPDALVKQVQLKTVLEKQLEIEEIQTDDPTKGKMMASQPFKVVDRDKSQSLINYSYPRDWNNYNNSVGRYSPRQRITKPTVLTHDFSSKAVSEIRTKKEKVCLNGLKKLAGMAIGENISVARKPFASVTNFKPLATQTSEISKESAKILGNAATVDAGTQKLSKAQLKQKNFIDNASEDALKRVLERMEIGSVVGENLNQQKPFRTRPGDIGYKTTSLVNLERSAQRQMNQTGPHEKRFVTVKGSLDNINQHKKASVFKMEKYSERTTNPFVLNLWANEQNMRKGRPPVGSDFYESAEAKTKFLLRTDHSHYFSKQLNRKPDVQNQSTQEFDNYYDRAQKSKSVLKDNKGVGLRDMGKIPGREDNLMYRINDGYNLDKRSTYTDSATEFVTGNMPSVFSDYAGRSVSFDRSVSNAISILNFGSLQKDISTFTLEEKILNDFYKPNQKSILAKVKNDSDSD